jgi:hypothetical protein
MLITSFYERLPPIKPSHSQENQPIISVSHKFNVKNGSHHEQFYSMHAKLIKTNWELKEPTKLSHLLENQKQTSYNLNESIYFRDNRKVSR